MPLWSADGSVGFMPARRDEERHIVAAPRRQRRADRWCGAVTIWPSAWTPGGKELVFVEDRRPPARYQLLDPPTIARSRRSSPGHPEMLRPVAGSPLDRSHPVERARTSWFGPSAVARRGDTPDGGGASRWLAAGAVVACAQDGFRWSGSGQLPELSIHSPRVFPGAVDSTVCGERHSYDVAPDGSRFLFIEKEPTRSCRPASRWWSTLFRLRRRAPVRP